MSKKEEKDSWPDVEEPLTATLEKFKPQIESLRSKMSTPNPDDLVLYRFLKGHKFNEAEALKFADANIKWRIEEKMDDIRNVAQNLSQKEFPFAGKILKCWPHTVLHGFDKKGQPLSIERLGMAHPYAFTRTIKQEELLKYHLYHMENKVALVDKMSREQDKIVRTCKIMDLSGLNRSHLDGKARAYFKLMVDLSQRNYPEMLGNLYVVNAPFVFNLGWKIVKPWLNPRTLDKIVILGSDYQNVLKENIDEKYIPEFLGGSCKCEELGGCVPVSDPDEGMKEEKISSRGRYDHVIEITSSDLGTEGVNICYEFRTRSNDIGFEAKFKNKKGEERMLSENQRYAAHEENVLAILNVKEEGTVTLTWDNSFSRFTSKQVLFRYELTPATESLENVEFEAEHPTPLDNE